ncbi:TPA: hypothetical protein ACX6S7_002459 [Photobacterium damselae]
MLLQLPFKKSRPEKVFKGHFYANIIRELSNLLVFNWRFNKFISNKQFNKYAFKSDMGLVLIVEFYVNGTATAKLGYYQTDDYLYFSCIDSISFSSSKPTSNIASDVNSRLLKKTYSKALTILLEYKKKKLEERHDAQYRRIVFDCALKNLTDKSFIEKAERGNYTINQKIENEDFLKKYIGVHTNVEIGRFHQYVSDSEKFDLSLKALSVKQLNAVIIALEL